MQGSLLLSNDSVEKYNIYYNNYEELSFIDFLNHGKFTKKDITPYYVKFMNNNPSKVSKQLMVELLHDEFVSTYVAPFKEINNNIFSHIVYKFNQSTLQNQSNEAYYFKVTDVIGEGNCWFHSTYKLGLYDFSKLHPECYKELRKTTNNGKKSKLLPTVHQVRHLLMDLFYIYYNNDPKFMDLANHIMSINQYIINEDFCYGDDYKKQYKGLGEDVRRKFQFCVRNARTDCLWTDYTTSILASYIFKTDIVTFQSDSGFTSSKEIINAQLQQLHSGNPPTLPDSYFQSTLYLYHHNSSYPFDVNLKEHPLLRISNNAKSSGEGVSYEYWEVNHYAAMHRISESTAVELQESGERMIIEQLPQRIPDTQMGTNTDLVRMEVSKFVTNQVSYNMLLCCIIFVFTEQKNIF